jgi:hypothetical protein
VTTKTEDVRTQVVAQLDEVEAELREANAKAKEERAQVAAREALGEITPGSAGARREEIKTALDSLRARRQAMQEALPALDARIEAEHEQARLAARASAGGKLTGAAKNREAASRALQKKFRELQTSVDELARHRVTVDEALAVYREHFREDEAFTWPDGPVDEAWEPLLQETLAVLVAGPLRPLADEAAAKVEAEKTAEVQDAEKIAWLRAARWPADAEERARSVLEGIDSESERGVQLRKAGEGAHPLDDGEGRRVAVEPRAAGAWTCRRPRLTCV